MTKRRCLTLNWDAPLVIIKPAIFFGQKSIFVKKAATVGRYRKQAIFFQRLIWSKTKFLTNCVALKANVCVLSEKAVGKSKNGCVDFIGVNKLIVENFFFTFRNH